MMKLKENSPDFQVVVGPFKGHKYEHGVEYENDKIPPMELKHFYEVEAVPVRSAKPSKATKQPKSAETKVEKSA